MHIDCSRGIITRADDLPPTKVAAAVPYPPQGWEERWDSVAIVVVCIHKTPCHSPFCMPHTIKKEGSKPPLTGAVSKTAKKKKAATLPHRVFFITATFLSPLQLLHSTVSYVSSFPAPKTPTHEEFSESASNNSSLDIKGWRCISISALELTKEQFNSLFPTFKKGTTTITSQSGEKGLLMTL